MPKTNCPNCGAPIDATKCKCDYCGTTYADLTTIQQCTDSWLRVNLGTKNEPHIVLIRGGLTYLGIEKSVDTCAELELRFLVYGVY